MPRSALQRCRAAPPPVSPAPPSSSACRDRPAPAAMLGTAFWQPNSITARGPAISSKSCRGWTSICGGRRRRARQPDPSFRDAPLGAGPESILTMVVMDSGLALRAPRNDKRESQRTLPGPADEIDAKAVVRLLFDAAETFGLIDAARRDKDALGPQRHFPVAFRARRADALLDERTADAEPT